MIISIQLIRIIIENFIKNYGGIAIFFSMLLESASLPIPSEVIMPFAGILVKEGILKNFIVIFVFSVLGSLIGVLIDYYIAYFIEKDLVYKHLKWFHIKKETINTFNEWFNENGSFAVFFARLIPVVRGLISFPAGFSHMNLKKFVFYSFIGIFIWNLSLMLFGFYFLSQNIAHLYILLIIISLFMLLLYFIYRIFLIKIKNKPFNRIKSKKM